ncbi:13147_t:CDS:2 [Funneliformis caledonium]|uniref:13147_t:CDS:1 n=1 Tax=Funneliformis caledonium TaxID=1117310 RepID=A0A9N9F1I2_9GLOM|nr:13147_t:CDS:2 [Funneliformis caledonium]
MSNSHHGKSNVEKELGDEELDPFEKVDEIREESNEGYDSFMVISPERLATIILFFYVVCLHQKRVSSVNISKKFTMTNITDCTEDTYLFVNEIQVIYGKHEVTPIEIIHTLGLDALLLTKYEFNVLVANFIQRYSSRSYFNIPEGVKNLIFNLTGGHPGLCRFILTLLRIKFREGIQNKSSAVILQYLASPQLRNGITSSSCAFYWINNWNPSHDEAEFVRLMLLKSHCETPSIIDYDSNPVAKKFLKHPTTTFEEFLEKSIHRMSPSKLSESFGRGDKCNSLYERSWQMEWYCAFTIVVPANESISADVGPLFSSTGFLDFYVNGDCCWRIELIREGRHLKEHAKRFENGGIYDKIPLKHWVIIDFRHHSKSVREKKPNFWYALYDDNYKQITIIRERHNDKVIILYGDE